MKTDLYTKVILTVIAVSLMGILLRDIPFVTTAHAQGTTPLSPFSPNPTANNQTKTELIKVDIVAINGNELSRFDVDAMNVALPVKIKD